MPIIARPRRASSASARDEEVDIVFPKIVTV
jgi:hypothetical protein